MLNNFLSGNQKDLQAALGTANRKMREQESVRTAQILNIPYLNLQGFPLNLNALGLFTEQEAKDAEGFPVFREGRDIRIVTTNPKNQLLQQKLLELKEKFNVSLYFVSKDSFDSTIKFYSKVIRPKAVHQEVITIEKEIDFQKRIQELSNLELQAQSNTTNLIADIFGAAVFYNASDIHIEPEDKFIKLRFRIDGVLQDMLHITKAVHKPMLARIKLQAKLKLNVENLPQDGRLTFFYLGRPIDVRISTLPSAYGEGIVMRLLGIGANQLKLDDLGLRGKALSIIKEALFKPNGMIITTGPTGSGKTTTLYSFLNQLNEPGVKIITLEDPVEYKLEGIQQTPIDHHVDFSFAKGLRAILRQDPDIVMVGEIRDAETAETAMQAALTGHVVLSTIHTNDAIGTIPRLITMGVKTFIIAPALNAIIAQRLVRKLCSNCKKQANLSQELMAKVIEILNQIPKNSGVAVPPTPTFYHAPGCEICHGLGYSGRVGIYEVIQVDEPIKELILKEATAGELKKQALTQGMVNMVQDGLLKAMEGITDVEEVFRVAGD